MKVDEVMVDVICKIENIIGSETYNASYNDGDGCDFRYPVEYFHDEKAKQEGKISKEKGMLNSCLIRSDGVETMNYKFGSNQLNIGIAIENVMAFLEKRYQLDFNQLELTYKKSQRDEMRIRLENGDSVLLGIGMYTVGIDFPAGNYIITQGKEEYSMPLFIMGRSDFPNNGDNIDLADKDVLFNVGNVIFKKT